MWWLRFCLGLHARQEDRDEVRRLLPEIFHSGFDIETLLPLQAWPAQVARRLTVGDLRQWADAGGAPSELAAISPESCPAEECPLRRASRQGQARDGLAILGFMVAGGVHKAPKAAFIDLVRRVHKNQQVKQVILTDRYIFSDVGEGHEAGGFDALIDYLKALGLTQKSVFDLMLNPSPAKASPLAPSLLKRAVNDHFPNAQVDRFSTRHRFHDRFYLTRDQSNKLAGVFGPSLNGLSAKAIVIMGELENNALQQLAGLL